MKKYLQSSIGRFRILAFLEGISLIVLIFICVPLKYFFDQPMGVKIIGPIHGLLFVLFVIDAMRQSVEWEWKFFKTTFWVLLSSFVPFGTFVVDAKILKPLHISEKE
jgi:integral membrane protein